MGFAALKNRLNSVSAIGYLHIAPRAAPTNASSSSFDRSSRLKGRDEGGIRWNELLEKFKSVQERARRAKSPGGDFDDGLGMADPRAGEGLDARAFKDLARLQGPPLPLKDVAVAPAGAQPAANKSKSSLGKFGRLGGAVSGTRPEVTRKS